MTWTLDTDARPLPRVAILSSRGGVRGAAMQRALEARRQRDGHNEDTSLVERAAMKWNDASMTQEFWHGVVLGVLACLLGAVIVVTL